MACVNLKCHIKTDSCLSQASQNLSIYIFSSLTYLLSLGISPGSLTLVIYLGLSKFHSSNYHIFTIPTYNLSPLGWVLGGEAPKIAPYPGDPHPPGGPHLHDRWY